MRHNFLLLRASKSTIDVQNPRIQRFRDSVPKYILIVSLLYQNLLEGLLFRNLQ